MRLERAFRFSGYLTLSLACVCLGLAAEPFISGLAVMAVPLFVILVVAFFLEGRVALPAWAANVLGIGIALGGTVWIGWQLYGRIDENGLIDVPIHAALLPFLGPLLIVLMVVKLLRPKQPVDYWVLQGLGLILVALSCVLATEPASGLLLLAYLASGLWHLTMLHTYREIVVASGGEKKPGESVRVPLTGSLIRSMVWTGATLAISLPLFLLLPRQGQGQTAWNPYQLFGGARPPPPRLAQTGFTNEIDLNRTGEVEVSDEIALTVEVEDAEGRPKLDLSRSQRWRGAVLEYYEDGRWISSAPLKRRIPAGAALVAPREDISQTVMGAPPPQPIGSSGQRLPDLGPDQFYVTFTFQARTAGGLFLAEPVVLHSRGAAAAGQDPLPIVSLQNDASRAPRFQEMHLALQTGVNLGRGEYSYRQVTRPSEETGLSEPVDHLKARLEYLRKPPTGETGVGNWTARLLDGLVGRSAYGLTKKDIEPVPVNAMGDTSPRNPEKVAVALTEYLGHSGEYTYTLDRRRDDTSIDPTLDFLQNIKQGHCERFAGALALMLRTQGIPARVVTGFRGAESKGNGVYAIRQNFAHSWVEVLVERGPEGSKHAHWLTLDPTPGTEAPPPTPFSWARWWEKSSAKGEALWKDLVLNYEGEQQDALLRDAWVWLSKDFADQATGGQRLSWGSFAFLTLAAVGVVPAFWLARRVCRRPRARSAARLGNVPFYNRLLALLARHARLRPQLTQTPREFAEGARRWLAASKATAPLADIPARLSDLLYRVRFGDRPLSEEECRTVDADLQRLAAGLSR